MMDDPDRLTRLEEKLTHAEHHLSQLDQVVRELGDQVLGVSRRLEKFQQSLTTLTDRVASSQPPPDAADEKPPHW